jgi:hypothetical protein
VPAGWLPSLLECLAWVADSRDRRGVRQSLVSLLGSAAAVVLAGSRGFIAVGEWVLDAFPQVWAGFGVRRDPLSGRFEPRDEAMIRWVVEEVDGDAFDGCGRFVAGRRGCRRPAARSAPTRCRAGVVGSVGGREGPAWHVASHGRRPVVASAVSAGPGRWDRLGADRCAGQDQRDHPVRSVAETFRPGRCGGHGRGVACPARARRFPGHREGRLLHRGRG